MLSFLFIDTERVWRGGQTQLLTLIEGLHCRGHQVHLACYPNTSLETRSRELDISVHPIAIRSEAGLISLIRLFFILRETQPDILGFNTPKPILMGSLASRFARTGARIIFRRVSFPLRNSWITRRKYTWGIDCIIAISRSIKSQLQEGGIPPSLIKIIYEGIDLSPYSEKPDPDKRPENAPTMVGTLAHLSHEKGIHYLIEAAALIPDVQRRMRFVIIGDGQCRRQLEELVSKKGLADCFQFLGFRRDGYRLLRQFDLFVLPSLSEGLSSAIIEAMASRLPVIASSVGGIPELVKDGENGILVPPADPWKLAAAIQQLDENSDIARDMGLRGRKYVEDIFTLERKIEETEKLCDTVLKNKSEESRQTDDQQESN